MSASLLIAICMGIFAVKAFLWGLHHVGTVLVVLFGAFVGVAFLQSCAEETLHHRPGTNGWGLIR